MDDLWDRCDNWGRNCWRELMRDAPDRSCVNSIYDMGKSDGDGWGEVDGDTQVVEQPVEARSEPKEIDEADAEVMHMWIRQIPKGAQRSLWARFVYRSRVGQDEVKNALRAIGDAMAANRAVVQRMRG